MEFAYREFGPVTVEYYDRRDRKTDIAIGKPMFKTVCPRDRFLVDTKGRFVFGEDGHAIRVK
jgi:hypothetical protein